MAELDGSVLEFYGLSNPYPVEWPAEKQDSDESETESKQQKAKLNRRKSRYQALERTRTNRSSNIPGAEKGNLVQRDEPDPLGTTDSVVMTLKRYGVPIQDDPRLRMVFQALRMAARLLTVTCARQSVPPVVDYLLSRSLPVADARQG